MPRINRVKPVAKLTEKQEAFCRVYIETGNASEAYRAAYDAENMALPTVNRSAKALMDNRKIAARLEELRAPIIQKHNITVDSLITELEEARMAALTAETPQSSAAVSATMAKAKLVGFDRAIIEHVTKGISDYTINITAAKKPDA